MKIPDFKTGSMITAGCLIGFALIYLFGMIADSQGTIDKDTLTPLYWIIPVMGGILGLLIARFNK